MGSFQMKRVVIDTNVLVSALFFGVSSGKLVSLWKGGAIQPLASAAMFEEYLRVLAYPKFDLSEEEIEFLSRRRSCPGSKSSRYQEVSLLLRMIRPMINLSGAPRKVPQMRSYPETSIC